MFVIYFGKSKNYQIHTLNMLQTTHYANGYDILTFSFFISNLNITRQGVIYGIMRMSRNTTDGRIK